jgi:site-specific DNA recombinase
LSRNVKDIYDFLDLISSKNVQFISVTDNFDTTSSMGRAMLGVAAVFAQLTRETISENVHDALTQKKRQGYFPVAAPYGYINTKDLSGRKIISEGTKPRKINGVKSFDKVPHKDVVKMIYDWYLNDNKGLMQIATMLNTMKIPTCNHPKTEMWNRQAILSILDNPTYGGYLRLDGKLVNGLHKPIIDKDTWQLVQQRRKERRTFKTRSQTSTNLLSGIVRCMTCNRAMVVHYSHAKIPAKEMRCVGNSRTTGNTVCRGFDVKVDLLEEFLLKEVFSLSDLFKDVSIIEARKMLLQNDTYGAKEKSNVIVEKMADIDKQIERWELVYTTGKISPNQFSKRNTTLISQRKKLEIELSEVESYLEKSCLDKVRSEDAIKLLKNFKKLWSKSEVQDQKEFLQIIVEYMFVSKHTCKLKLFIGEEKLFSF